MGGVSPAHQGHLAMLLFSALVAGSFSLGAQVANEINPVALNAVRFWIAAAVIGLVACLTTGVPATARHAPWRYIILGGLFGTYFVLMFEGLKTAAPVSAAAVFTLTPVLSAAFGWLLLRQIMTPRMALALSIGAAGALWVIFRADLAALRAFAIGMGETIYFFGVVCHAIYTPMVRKLNRGEPVLVFTLGTLLGGAFVLTLYGWPAIRATHWDQLPALVWITLFYLALFASAASVLLLQTASLRLPSAKVMAYTYLVPSWVICWEVAQGKGLPAPILLGGVFLTVFALALLLREE
ncbi:MAG: DMT family transporter [Pseudomonadota bacterium]